MTPDRLAALAMFAVLVLSLVWLVRWVRQSLSWRPVWDRFRREPLALAGLAFVLVLVSVAILAPVLPLRDPNHGYYELLPLNGRPLAPGATFLLGSGPCGALGSPSSSGAWRISRPWRWASVWGRWPLTSAAGWTWS
jgi:hypothetical protein